MGKRPTDVLLWEALPFVMIGGVSGFIALINWDYEATFFKVLPNRTRWLEAHSGLVFLSMAIGLGLVASLILFGVRLANPKGISLGWRLAVLCGVAIFFIFPALFIVVLGPAAIVMMEQANPAR